MDLTGNPFVDTGLMVLAALADKDQVSSLTFCDIRRVFGNGLQLARDNENLKCFTMVFGTNGPLTQHAYKKIGKNSEIYLSIIREVLRKAESEGESGLRCDITGILTDFDFHSVCANALRQAHLSVPERKWLGRDFVPLAGSLGNDAQALPCASRPLHVSAIALFALQYLPMGVFLFKGKLTCYQSTATELTQALVSQVVEKNRERLALGEREILGKGGGSGVILEFLTRHFEHLTEVPHNAELTLWLFSNSGTGADCEIEEVPEFALQFVYDAMSRGFGSEIRRLVASDPKDSRSQLFECVRASKDYPGLYPYRKEIGASPEFYEFYQRSIRGATQESLDVARKLAALVIKQNRKIIKQIRKPEFLRSQNGRNLIRKFIIENLTMGEYDALFPSCRHPIRVNSSAWQFLRYYLSREEEDARSFIEVLPKMKTTHPKIVQIAETYRGRDARKIKNLLDRMAQRKIGIAWLQDTFCRLAEQHKEWEFGEWDEFVCDDEGKFVGFELLFQIRLYLSNIYREAMEGSKGEAA